MLLERYQKYNTVFDLAKYESTYINGKTDIFIRNKQKYYSLIPIYASDEGHLNELGKKIIGLRFLIFLSSEN
jgi:hypothetical protein